MTEYKVAVLMISEFAGPKIEALDWLNSVEIAFGKDYIVDWASQKRAEIHEAIKSFNGNLIHVTIHSNESELRYSVRGAKSMIEIG